jgi:hypothetical protein
VSPEPRPAIRDSARQTTTLWMAVLSTFSCAMIVGQQPALLRLAVFIAAVLSVALFAAFRQLAAIRPAFVGGWPMGLLLGTMMALPFLANHWRISLVPHPRLELLFLAGLRNTTLVAAAFCYDARMMRLALRGSLFGVIFGFALPAAQAGSFPLAIALAFAALGVIWLAQSHAVSMAPYMADHRLPGLSKGSVAALGILAAGGCMLGVLLYPEDLKTAFEKVLGVAAAKTGLGVREQERLGRANRELLEGLAEDLYGKNADPRKGEANNAGSQSGSSKGGGGVVNGEQSGEPDFSLFRVPGSPDAPKRRSSKDVLFQVQAHGPSHLPVTTYDHWDGKGWHREETQAGMPQMFAELSNLEGWGTVVDPLDFVLDPNLDPRAKDWQRLANAKDAVDWSRGAMRQMAMEMQGGGRVVDIRRTPLLAEHLTALLTLPPGDINSAPSKTLTSPYDQQMIDRILREKIPPEAAAQVSELLSHEEIRTAVLQEYLKWRVTHRMEALPPRAAKLVSQWIAGKRQGWEEIHAVIEGLRSHAVHDREGHLGLAAADPVEYFLFESRRGPDFLFASTAAVLQRHLGYPSRMVGGFYVPPDNFRRLTGTTPIKAGDVHFWTQVRMRLSESDRNGEMTAQWVNLEPTPGFQPYQPEPTWEEWFASASRSATDWFRRHAVAIITSSLALIGLVLFRRRLVERVATLVWHLSAGRSPDRLVAATWRLVERRCRVAGHYRPTGRTLRAWYPAVANAPEARQRLLRLADLADWAAHAPAGLAGSGRYPERDVRQICREAVDLCTVSAFRIPKRSSSFTHPESTSA